MHEKKKISEAVYFYDRMLKEQDKPEALCYELSAFLSAARSALQYAIEEVKYSPTQKKWYEERVVASPVIQFFRCKRDINIHIKPVKPIRHVTASIQDNLPLSDSIRIVIRREDGSEDVLEPSNELSPDQPEDTENISFSNRYYFSDWEGDEDVFALCKNYLKGIKGFIEDGIKRGFISG